MKKPQVQSLLEELEEVDEQRVQTSQLLEAAVRKELRCIERSDATSAEKKQRQDDAMHGLASALLGPEQATLLEAILHRPRQGRAPAVPLAL